MKSLSISSHNFLVVANGVKQSIPRKDCFVPRKFGTETPNLRAERSSLNTGFTLIEIMVTVGLIAIIASIGMVLTMDFYRTFAFNSETQIIVSALQKARNQAMSNVNQADHGVRFESGKYIVFEDGAPAKDLEIKAQQSVTVTGAAEIVFDQLSGNSSDATLTVTSTSLGKTKNIIINAEGRIDVQP